MAPLSGPDHDVNVRMRAETAFVLDSLAGRGAIEILLPIIRALVAHIEGQGPLPIALAQVPDIGAKVALERARYRAAVSD